MTEAAFRLHLVDMPADDASVATVTGEIDVTNAEEFVECVDALSATSSLVLDLSRVRYLDSAGFAALDRLLAERTVLIVIAPDSGVYRAAVVMELPFHHDTDSALRIVQAEG